MLFIPPKPIQPTAIYAGCIYEFENIWPDYETVIQELEQEVSNPDNLFSFVPAETLDATAFVDECDRKLWALQDQLLAEMNLVESMKNLTVKVSDHEVS
jgi:hypothetical protein